jgi:hypothetical protein
MTTRAPIVVLLALTVAVTIGRSPRVAAQSQPVNQLEWMAGCWSMTRGDAIVEEHWMNPAGGTMLGMSRTVRRGTTTEYEFLQIRDVNGTLRLSARVEGKRNDQLRGIDYTYRPVLDLNATSANSGINEQCLSRPDPSVGR